MLRNTFEDHVTYSQNFILFLFHLYSAFYHFFQVPTVYFSRIFKINKDDNYVEVHFSCYLWNVKAWLRKFHCFRFTLLRDVAQYLWGSRNILSELIVFIPSLFGFMSLFFGLYRVLGDHVTYSQNFILFPRGFRLFFNTEEISNKSMIRHGCVSQHSFV